MTANLSYTQFLITYAPVGNGTDEMTAKVSEGGTLQYKYGTQYAVGRRLGAEGGCSGRDRDIAK